MGGSENLTLTFISEDKKNKHTIVVFQGHTSFQDNCIKYNNIEFINLNFKTNSYFNLSNWLKIFQVVNNHKPDIIQAYMYDASKYARFVGFFSRVPVFIYIVNTYEYKKIRRAFFNYILSFLTKKVFVNSENVLSDVMYYDKIPKRKIILMPSFVSFNYEADHTLKIRNRLGIKKNDYLFLFIARLVEQKGIINLLHAVDLSVNTHKERNIKFVIMGDGELRNFLVSEILRLNLENFVFLVGEFKNINPFLTEADAYIDSSLRSGLSVAAINAMEASLPMIMTDVGGVNELNEGKKYISLCPAGNVNLMSNLIESFVKRKKRKDPALSEYVRQKFAAKNIIDKILNSYQDAI